MEKINNIQEQISSLDKLKVDEAKELYMKAISSTDEELKKLYLDKVILGTLYVVNNYIERNDLKILQGSSYDIDDIKSAFTETWIKKIKNGELLSIDRFSQIITPAFINDVCMNLTGNEVTINEQYGFTVDRIIDLFHAYVQLKNTGKDFNFDDLMQQYYKEKRLYYSRVPYSSKDNIILLLLEGMYNNLDFDKKEDLDITRTKISNFIRLFMNNGLFDKMPEDVTSDDKLEEVLDDMMNKDFIKYVDEILTDERKRTIIHQRFGLDGEVTKTIEELANQYCVSKPRINQLEARSIRYLRNEMMRNRIKQEGKSRKLK